MIRVTPDSPFLQATGRTGGFSSHGHLRSERTEHLLSILEKTHILLLHGVGTEWNTSALGQCKFCSWGSAAECRGLWVNVDIHCCFLMVLNE